MGTIKSVSSWIDRFEREYCGKRVVRGRVFTGVKVEIHPGSSDGWDVLEVHLTGPLPLGNNSDDRMVNFVFEQNEYVFARFSFEKFENVLNGLEEISDDEWIWDDEV